MSGARRARALFAGLAVASCHRGGSATVADASGPALALNEDAGAAAVAARPTTLAARCQPAAGGYALDDGHGLDDLAIGDAFAGKTGIAVGVVHRAASGRVASVAVLPSDAGSMKLRDLGPTLGDAPPPRVAWRGAELLAVSYGLSRRPEVRELSLYVGSASGDVHPSGALAELRDDSLAFDLTPTLLVWDQSSGEAKAGAVPRGVIRIAEVGPDGHPGAPRDVSPAESDAELPRIVAMEGGPAAALVFWIARKLQVAAALDAGASAEATGEARAYSWLEVVAVDAQGAPSSAGRRLTAATGHVTSYDLEPPPRAGAPRPEVIVVARDDGEAIDGSGGALLRVRVSAEGQEPAVAFEIDGLGRGAPAFVASVPGPIAAPPWLFWVAPREEGRLLSLDGAGAPTQLPTAEPSLDEGRPLVWLEPGRRMLAAMPDNPAGQLRVLSCAAPP